MEQFHSVASSMLWELASSLQIACCYKVPEVHHLFPISRTVHVDATIGESGTFYRKWFYIGTEVMNFRALVCGQTACHPLALAAWLFPFHFILVLGHFLLPWSNVYQSMKHAVSFVWNMMMLTRIDMFCGGDSWPNSSLCTDQVRMGNWTGGVVYNAGGDVHVLRLANGHQETEEVEGERASTAPCSGEDHWLRAMEASHRQSEAWRPQLHSKAQS